MRLIIITILLLAIAFWAGLEMSQHPGYLYISIDHWQVEMSLWVAIGGVIGLFIASFLLIRLFSLLVALPLRLRRWARLRRIRLAAGHSRLGFQAMVQSNWKLAETQWIKATHYQKKPWFLYVMSARAAHILKDWEQRDAYLQKASKVNGADTLTIGIAQLSMLIENKQWEQAQAVLSRLDRKYAQHTELLRLKTMVFEHFEEWHNLEKILPVIKKSKMLTEEEWLLLEIQVYAGLLQTAEQKGIVDLLTQWNEVPRALRHDMTFQMKYVHCLLRLRHEEEAASWLEQIVKHECLLAAIDLYIKLTTLPAERRLERVKSWMKRYPNEMQLYYYFGVLCFELSYWGKAKESLEKALATQKSAKTYAVLAQVYEKLDDHEAAYACYRAGLADLK